MRFYGLKIHNILGTPPSLHRFFEQRDVEI